MTLARLLGGTFAALAAATLVGQVLARRARSQPARTTVANVNLRIAAWWGLCGTVALALWLGEPAVLALFATFSVIAQKELLALVPGAPSWRWMAVFPLLQYALVWRRDELLFAVLVPVLSFLAIAVHRALTAPERLFAMTARTWCATFFSSCCLSYAPALLALPIAGYADRNATLLFYLLLIAQAGDVLQYISGKLAGRTPLAPRISPHKTREGLAGGLAGSVLLGAALYSATPFPPAEAAAVSTAITLAGVAGGLVMSALKRDAGIKDFGRILPGHGGIMDRADSLCFSAPLFYYFIRCFHSA